MSVQINPDASQSYIHVIMPIYIYTITNLYSHMYVQICVYTYIKYLHVNSCTCIYAHTKIHVCHIPHKHTNIHVSTST